MHHPSRVVNYHQSGWAAVPHAVEDAALTSARDFARKSVSSRPPAAMLSGIHNPFGYHAGLSRAWAFLDLAQNSVLLDLVEGVLGPDVVLWDSEMYLAADAFGADEAAKWPVDPLAGTLLILALDSAAAVLVDIRRLSACHSALPLPPGPLYVLRYMPATSHFNRDPLFEANRYAAEERPLVNYTKRPLWLVRGEDRGGNDFATGFSVRVGQWASGTQTGTPPPISRHDINLEEE
jgi:hypothetical protein